MPHPCEIPRGRDAFLDATAGKRLPRKIVLKKSDFNKLDSKTQGIIRKYNNEVKIYSNYYRKIYKADEPLFVILPMSRLDIDLDFIKALGNEGEDEDIVLDDDLIDFNKEKNKDINSIKLENIPKLKLNKTKQIFLTKYFSDELVKYNTAVYNYYKNNETEFKACLGLPKFPSNVKKIIDNYEAMIKERRNMREPENYGTMMPYLKRVKGGENSYVSPSDVDLKVTDDPSTPPTVSPPSTPPTAKPVRKSKPKADFPISNNVAKSKCRITCNITSKALGSSSKKYVPEYVKNCGKQFSRSKTPRRKPQ